MTTLNQSPDQSNDPFVLIRDSGPVRWLTLNRPKQRNPLSSGMIDGIATALQEAYGDGGVRVIVLDAAGPVFSAGHDLMEMSDHTDNKEAHALRLRAILQNCADMMLSIPTGPKPVIASVSGTATAAGCQLVAFCDLALCSSQARFATPGVNVGMFCTTPLVGIGRKIHRKHAMEMALTGEFISAEDAFRFGLVNRVVPFGDLETATEDLAQLIASKSAQSIAGGKRAFYDQIDMPLEQAFDYTLQVMLDGAQTDDAHEGSKAFFEKRKPEWTKE